MARALVGLAVLAAALPGCGTESSQRRGIGEVESALRTAGLRICATPEAGKPPESADRERAFVVAIDCADEDDQAVVAVIEWPDPVYAPGHWAPAARRRPTPLRGLRAPHHSQSWDDVCARPVNDQRQR